MMDYTRIESSFHPFELRLGEVFRYKDLVFMFVKRDFKVRYAQTILGPLWLFLTPLLTSIVYMVVFGNVLGVSVSGMPKLLFYLVSNSFWIYFSSCIADNAKVFVQNAGLFGKVYFPRLSVPIANMFSNIILLGVQMILSFAVWVWYAARGDISPRYAFLWVIIVVVFVMGLFGIGLGIIISGFTAKYRDLSILITFGVSLIMYISPVIYTAEMVKGGAAFWLWLNPVTAMFELLRWAVAGYGSLRPWYIVYSATVSLLVFLAGVLIFNRTEHTFMDTV